MREPRGSACAKTYSQKLRALKIVMKVMSAVRVQLAEEVLGPPPPQPWSWSLSWLPSSDPLGTGSWAGRNTDSFSHIWHFVADV